MPNRRVLVIDDSITIRAMIEQIFATRHDISVVGVVGRADDALVAIGRLRPDVLTLDLNMPGMDGLTFLSQVMRERPMPVVIVSSSSTEGSEACQQALALGASECFDKAHILSDASTFRRAVQRAKIGEVRPC